MAIIGMESGMKMEALQVLSPVQYKVYEAIGVHVNESGTAWPSLDRIAEVANVSRRSVIYAVHKLEAQGFVHVDHGRGRGISNVYHVVSRWVKKVQNSFRGREGGYSTSQSSLSIKEMDNDAAPPSGTRRLHLFGWPELEQSQKFLNALHFHYEENIGPLSSNMEQVMETRLALNPPPPEEIAEAIVSEAIVYNRPTFGYVLSVLDATIKRGWIRDSRPGQKGYLRFGSGSVNREGRRPAPKHEVLSAAELVARGILAHRPGIVSEPA